MVWKLGVIVLACVVLVSLNTNLKSVDTFVISRVVANATAESIALCWENPELNLPGLHSLLVDVETRSKNIYDNHSVVDGWYTFTDKMVLFGTIDFTFDYSGHITIVYHSAHSVTIVSDASAMMGIDVRSLLLLRPHSSGVIIEEHTIISAPFFLLSTAIEGAHEAHSQLLQSITICL